MADDTQRLDGGVDVAILGQNHDRDHVWFLGLSKLLIQSHKFFLDLGTVRLLDTARISHRQTSESSLGAQSFDEDFLVDVGQIQEPPVTKRLAFNEALAVDRPLALSRMNLGNCLTLKIWN